ncbi:hypothetical protein [Stenotrophomonas phage SOVA965]
MTKKVRPPVGWMDLRGGDSVNTRIVKHRLDIHLATMREAGFDVDTEATKRGYRVIVNRSPHDKPVKPKLKLLKGGKDE